MTDIPPLSPEVLVPRLGEYLVEKGYITQLELSRALSIQKKERKQGDYRMTGQILIEMGAISRDNWESVTNEFMPKLSSALAESNNQLSKANQQLIDANQQLEQRVKERTAQLQRAIEKLSELNQLKANIVANISHELRTPLTHLKGYMELLLDEDLGTLNDQQQNALSIMERSSERLGRLIEDLILFSVSERDQLHVHIAPFAVESLCTTIIQKSALRAKERSIRLMMTCDPDLPEVNADEEKISWVILQFIDNAFKFSKSGGMVKLRVQRDGDHVELSVLDNGMGIPATQLDEIFDSFHQLDGSSTRRAGGTGLGLALAKKIIEAHESQIRVTSEIGKGSCFAFSLNINNA